MIPIETTGLLGGSRMASAVRSASRTPGAAAARSKPATMNCSAGSAAWCRTHHSWKWINDDMRLDRHIGHRQQPDAAIGQAPTLRESGGDLTEREALTQPLRAHDVRGQIQVAEGEPLGERAVCRELGLDPRRLLRAPPALTFVDSAAQGVQQRVDIGADPQTVQGQVIAGIGNHRDLRPGQGRSGGEVVHQAADEPGATHATGEDSDLHGPQCVISEPLIGVLVTLPI